MKSLTHGPSVPQEWMYDIRKSNGPLAEVNSHDIDAARWFVGSEIEEVYAIGGNFRCPQAVQKYPDFYDNVAMVCRFEDGRQGFIDGAVPWDTGTMRAWKSSGPRVSCSWAAASRTSSWRPRPRKESSSPS